MDAPRRRRSHATAVANSADSLRLIIVMTVLVGVAFLLPPISMPSKTTPTEDPPAPRGAIRIVNRNTPAEPYRGDWSGQLAANRNEDR